MATKQLDIDSFIRANQSGWGTASGGSTWGTTLGTPTLSIASNEGHATGITAQANMQLGSTTSQNAEGLVRVKTNNSSATRMGISLRQTASNTFYQGRLSANANNIVIGKIVSGTSTDLFTAAFTVTTGSFYWIRFKVVNTNLYCRAWLDGNSEPSTWNVSGTDSSISGAGGFGLTINSSSSTTTWDFDSYTVTDANVYYDTTYRGVLSKATTKDTAYRGKVSALVAKNTSFRGNIGHTGVKDTTFRGVLSATGRKDTAFRGKVGHGATKDTVFRANISAWITSGGFTLAGNGTGTVSFDHARWTQYPDPALSLAPVLARLGSSNVAWNSNLPANTSLTVKTSTDGINFSTATSGSSIPGLTGQPDPTIDLWTSDTSANYTNTNKSGGSAATPTYDTTNSRITLSGGSSGVYLYTAISDDDVDVLCVMDRSDAGGLVWRFVDTSNYYELGVYDDSSSGGFTNTMRLYKVATGTRSLLGSAAITWPRSTIGTSPYKLFRVTMLAGVITCYFDGASLITYTDGSPLGAGKAGLRNDGGTSRYYQLRIQQQGDYVSGTPAGDTVTGKFVYTEQDLATTDPSVTPQVLDITTSARSPQIATGALITQLHDPSKPFAVPYNKEFDTLAQASGDFYTAIGPDSLGNPASLTFAERHATPAPWCLHSSDLLFAAKVTPTLSADLYRNRMTIVNTVGITDTLTESKIADGTATSWNMAYPLYSAPTITVAGVSKTVGVQGVDTGKDFYWQANSASIGQDSGTAKIPSGYVISFSYVGQFADMVTRDNIPEQQARAAIETGTSGIVEWVEDGKGMLSSNAIVYADGLLARFSNNDTVDLVATTMRSGLAKGQLLPTFIAEHKLNNRQLLIVKVTTIAEQQGDGSVLYFHQVEATDGSNLSNWSAALGF